MANVTGWTEFKNGSYIQATSKVHTNIIGDFFWAFLLLGGLWMVYTKTENFTTTTIVGMFAAVGMQEMLPTQTYTLFSLAILLGLTTVVYQFIKGR